MGSWPRFPWGTPGDADLGTETDARAASRSAGDGGAGSDGLRLRALHRGVALFVLGTIFLAGSVAAIVGQNGYRDLERMRHEARQLHSEAARLTLEVEGLAQAVRRLERDPLSRERIARDDLGLVRPREISFLLPEERSGDLSGPAWGAGGTPADPEPLEPP